MTRYAADTSVPVERSRADVERILRRYGASSFAYGWEGSRSVIQFDYSGRRMRIVMSMPDPSSAEFQKTPAGQRRSPSAAQVAWEKACRQRWRAFVLVIKAKLEAVESGITTVEDEFLAWTVLPDGRTFGEWARPQLDAAYSGGSMPALLPGVTATG
jgi:hypothetical protein